jgi:hypothetical protein
MTPSTPRVAHHVGRSPARLAPEDSWEGPVTPPSTFVHVLQNHPRSVQISFARGRADTSLEGGVEGGVLTEAHEDAQADAVLNCRPFAAVIRDLLPPQSSEAARRISLAVQNDFR